MKGRRAVGSAVSGRLVIVALTMAAWLIAGAVSTSAIPSSCSAPASAKAVHVSTASHPQSRACARSQPFCLDADGDGYGVGSANGPDADDADEGVNTPETLLAKYGSLPAFLGARGLDVRRVFYIARGGNDRKGLHDDESRPFATWLRVYSLLRPGDIVVFRQGTYQGNPVIDCTQPRWRDAKAPVIVMAYPGEKVVLSSSGHCISIGYSSNLVFDGFVLDNPDPEGYGVGLWMNDSSKITIRNVESMHHTWGLFGMQDLHNILIENNVVHDNLQEHGIYLGSRDLPNSDITVRGTLMYHNGRHGFQHNGRVTNLVVENNVIHSNVMGGIALLEGVSNSFIRGNLIFNNDKQGITFYNYDDPSPNTAIFAYDQNNNVIENNIIWVGRDSWEPNGQSPADFSAIEFTDDTAAQAHSMSGNVIRNNTLVTYNGPTFKFSSSRFAAANTITDNTICRYSGPGQVLQVAGTTYGLSGFGSYSGLFSGNVFGLPRFTDVSLDYYARPDRFDFSLCGHAVPGVSR